MHTTASLFVLFAAAVTASSSSTTNFNNDPRTTPTYVLNDAIIATINNDPRSRSTWIAARNTAFEGVTLSEAKTLLGALDTTHHITTTSDDLVQQETAARVGKNPLNFDSRQQWPGCVGAIRNQQRCGGCWAFGAAEVLSDRFCIAGVNVTLSPQDLMSCGHVRTPPKYMLGCDGGVPEYAWKYLEETGISTDACIPFVTTMDNMTEACPHNQTCDSTKYKAKQGSTRLLNGASSAAQQYMSDPTNGGPIQAVFYVYQDFFAYKSGIYTHTNKTQRPLGKHSVKVVGYGLDNGAPYWTVANSWGVHWGMDGFFKIGQDECMITSEMVFGQPAV